MNGLPGRVMELPALEVLKARLDVALGDSLVFGDGLDAMVLGVFSTRVDAVIACAAGLSPLVSNSCVWPHWECTTCVTCSCGENLFLGRMVRYWHRFAQSWQLVDAPSLGVLNTSLDGALIRTWPDAACPSHGRVLERDHPFEPNPFCDSLLL